MGDTQRLRKGGIYYFKKIFLNTFSVENLGLTGFSIVCHISKQSTCIKRQHCLHKWLMSNWQFLQGSVCEHKTQLLLQSGSPCVTIKCLWFSLFLQAG